MTTLQPRGSEKKTDCTFQCSSKIFRYSYQLILGISLLISGLANATQFVYSEKNKTSFDEIGFTNGEILIVTQRKPPNGEGQEVFRKKNNSSDPVATGINDDYVKLVSAFPNKKNASVAIITKNCGGNMCSWTDMYVAYTYKDSVLIDYLGAIRNQDFQITTEIVDKTVAKVVATRIWDGEKDKYGDPILSNRSLTLGKGFLHPNFQKTYLNLIRVHPEEFFSNKRARELLAQEIGPEQFQSLRSHMQVASESTVSEGRFIIFNGCMPHNCDDSAGAVVLDAFTGNTWALWIERSDNIYHFYGTEKLTKGTADQFISQIFFGEDVAIEFIKEGLVPRRIQSGNQRMSNPPTMKRSLR